VRPTGIPDPERYASQGRACSSSTLGLLHRRETSKSESSPTMDAFSCLASGPRTGDFNHRFAEFHSDKPIVRVHLRRSAAHRLFRRRRETVGSIRPDWNESGVPGRRPAISICLPCTDHLEEAAVPRSTRTVRASLFAESCRAARIRVDRSDPAGREARHRARWLGTIDWPTLISRRTSHRPTTRSHLNGARVQKDVRGDGPAFAIWTASKSRRGPRPTLVVAAIREARLHRAIRASC